MRTKAEQRDWTTHDMARRGDELEVWRRSRCSANLSRGCKQSALSSSLNQATFLFDIKPALPPDPSSEIHTHRFLTSPSRRCFAGVALAGLS